LCRTLYRYRPCGGLIPVLGVLPTVYRLRNLKKTSKIHKGCRSIDRWVDG
jgi:hypothetical protein